MRHTSYGAVKDLAGEDPATAIDWSALKPVSAADLSVFEVAKGCKLVGEFVVMPAGWVWTLLIALRLSNSFAHVAVLLQRTHLTSMAAFNLAAADTLAAWLVLSMCA